MLGLYFPHPCHPAFAGTKCERGLGRRYCHATEVNKDTEELISVVAILVAIYDRVNDPSAASFKSVYGFQNIRNLYIFLY